jgi:hypothetical protein
LEFTSLTFTSLEIKSQVLHSGFPSPYDPIVDRFFEKPTQGVRGGLFILMDPKHSLGMCQMATGILN